MNLLVRFARDLRRLGAPLAGALQAVLDRASERATGDAARGLVGDGERVRPGSLGRWTGDEAAV